MTSLKESIGWEEDVMRPGLYTREAQSMETFFTTLRKAGFRDVISICAVVNAMVSNLEDCLSLAWKRLRIACPSLATKIEFKGDKAYFSYDINDEEQWFRETFFIHHGVNGQELFSQTGDISRAQFHWLQHNGKHEYYIATPHDFNDVYGLMHLMNLFLEILSKNDNTQLPKAGSEVGRLSPGLSIAAGALQDGQGELEGEILKIVSESPDVGCLLPMKGLVMASTSIGEREVNRKLSEQNTRAVVDACKHLNVTVTQAFHAAMVLAILKINPPSGKETKYNSILPVDLRNRLLEQYQGGKVPVGVYILSMGMFNTLPVASEYTADQFLSVAQDFKEEYQRIRQNPRILNQATSFGDLFSEMFHGPQRPPKISPFLSSMGVVDKYFKTTYGPHVVLEDFSLRVNILGNSQILMWTFRGCLQFSTYYAVGAFEDKVMEAWMDEIVATLASGLKITNYH